MGIFDLLLGLKKENYSDSRQPSSQSESSRKDPVDEGFKSAKWVIREAFDKVMRSVSIPAEKKEALLNAFQSAHRSGDPRKEEEAVIRHLSETGWKWLEYEKWAAIFKERQQYPYMWWKYGLAESDSDIKKPESISDAIGYFKVNELKNFLKKHNINLKPTPKTRAELELRFKEIVSWEDFKPVAIEQYEEIIKKEVNDKEENLCRLLTHTLTMTTYSLVRYYQIQELLQNSVVRYRIVISSAGDSIEDEFAQKYNRGEIKDLPPYFHGDRNSITAENNL